MNQRILVTVLLSLFLIMSFSNVVNAPNYPSVFGLTEYPGGSIKYSLTVSTTSSLYNYYESQNHNLITSADFPKFITPDAVKPIADSLWNVCSSNETFADAVLGIAQQITYHISPEVYPVETLKLNYGDCGSLSLLAASILKAGGLDVVLLEYPSQQHLNMGVNLLQRPVYARSNAYYVDYNGERYYMAESTGNNFPNGWRVGECPTELRQTNPNIISIEGYEQSAPGQVSASYKTLSLSQISISLSSSFAMENSIVDVAGIISPHNAERVSIYVSTFGGVWQSLAAVNVDSNGHFAYQWKPQGGGIYYVQASWSGNADYAGADSQAATLYVIPFYGLIAIAFGIILLVLLVAFWLMNRHANIPPATMEKPQTPSEPTEPPKEEAQQLPQHVEEQQPAPITAQEETTQTQESQTTTQETATSSQPTTPPSQEEPPQPTPETTPETTTPAESTSEPEPPQEIPQQSAPTTPAPESSIEPQPQTTQPAQEPSQAPEQLLPQEQKPPEQQSETAP